MTRLLGVFAIVVTMLVASPSPASAVQTLTDGNTYGEYDCQLKFPKNDQYVDYLCNVVDKECDDYGVFVELKIYMNLTYDNGNTAFFRVTPNAGGCGNYKLGKYRRWDTGPGSADIKKVCARLTKDVPWGNDKPYKYTLDCVYS